MAINIVHNSGKYKESTVKVENGKVSIVDKVCLNIINYDLSVKNNMHRKRD